MSSPRRRARELALQGLYQWQFTGGTPAAVLRDLAELEGYDEADRAFLKSELSGAMKHAEANRAVLEPLADRKWEEVSPVERAILLLGAWELGRCPEIPYRVAINEAIELAKRFGGTDGHKYVNGILDRFAAQARAEEIAAGGAPAGKPRAGGARRATRKTPA